MRLEPAAPRSQVKHSTSEPLRSLYRVCAVLFIHTNVNSSLTFRERSGSVIECLTRDRNSHTVCIVKKMAIRNLIFSLYNNCSVFNFYLFFFMFLTKHVDNLTLE